MNHFGYNYPAGAEHDPNAPYNEKDAPELHGAVRDVLRFAIRDCEIELEIDCYYLFGSIKEITSIGYWSGQFGKLRKLNIESPAVKELFWERIEPRIQSEDYRWERDAKEND